MNLFSPNTLTLNTVHGIVFWSGVLIGKYNIKKRIREMPHEEANVGSGGGFLIWRGISPHNTGSVP